MVKNLDNDDFTDSDDDSSVDSNLSREELIQSRNKESDPPLMNLQDFGLSAFDNILSHDAHKSENKIITDSLVRAVPGPEIAKSELKLQS